MISPYCGGRGKGGISLGDRSLRGNEPRGRPEAVLWGRETVGDDGNLCTQSVSMFVEFNYFPP